MERDDSSMEVFNVLSNKNNIAREDMEGQKIERSWLECVMGCKIDERKEVTNLNCLHFLCSEECIEKLINETKPGVGLKCEQCCTVIPTEQLAMKIIPAEVFVKKKTGEDVQLLCDFCIHDKPAVSYCPECLSPRQGPFLLCLDCKDLHPQMKQSATHKVKDDLTLLKNQELTKVLEEESKCKIHVKPGDSYCLTCRVRICELCVPKHREHKTVHVETVKENLKSKMEDARRLRELCERATVDIQKKREELLNSEWDNGVKMIGDGSAVLPYELMERKDAIKGEVKAYFKKQKENLDIIAKCVELSKAMNERFISFAEEIINNRKEIACINFCVLYENVFEELKNMETFFTTYFDNYWEHGELNELAVSKVQEFLSKFDGIEYSLKPSDVDETADVDDELCDSELKIVSVVSLARVCDPPEHAKEIVGKIEKSKECKLNGALCEDSIKTMQLTIENGKPALNSCLMGSIDKGVGQVGILRKIGKKRTGIAKQVARKSTGCARVTAWNAKRSSLANWMEESSDGVEFTLSRPSTNAPEIGSQVQGREKRQRKKKESPDYIYTCTVPRHRRSRKSVPEKTESPSATGGKLGESHVSQLFIIENYILTEEEENDVLDEEIVQIVTAMEAADKDNEQNWYDDEPVAGPSWRKTLPKKCLRPIAEASVIYNPISLGHTSSMKVAPESTLESLPSAADYPVLDPVRMNIWNRDGNFNFCAICLDPGEEAMVCCDFCPRSFHFTCHLPELELEEGDDKWRCPYQTGKKRLDKMIASIPDVPGSVEAPLELTSNRKQFLLACSFVLKVYNFSESPTIRYIFPDNYYDMYGKVPFNLKYIRGRLGEGKPEPFVGVKDMLLAFRQMFVQSSIYYTRIRNEDFREVAERCFVRFLELLTKYYPGYFHLYAGIEF